MHKFDLSPLQKLVLSSIKLKNYWVVTSSQLVVEYTATVTNLSSCKKQIFHQYYSTYFYCTADHRPSLNPEICKKNFSRYALNCSSETNDLKKHVARINTCINIKCKRRAALTAKDINWGPKSDQISLPGL